MQAVEWLPLRTLTVAEVLAYRDFDHITAISPMLGLLPSPREHVVAIYVGVHETTLWTVYDRDNETWRQISKREVKESIHQTAHIVDEVVAWLTAHYPDERYGFLKNVDPRGN